jgi:hypothetical protein
MLLAGCEAQATPMVAVLPPTATPIPIPTLPPPLRYALTANTQGYVPNLARLEATGLVEQLSDNNTDENVIGGYDLVITFGTVAGWQTAPMPYHIALIMNATLPPLDQFSVVDALRRTLNPPAVIGNSDMPGVAANELPAEDPLAMREVLANQGYPDGFDLVLAMQKLPLVDSFIPQINALGFRLTTRPITAAEVLPVLETQQAHLLIASWRTEAEREAWEAVVGVGNVLDLYTIPISYRALDGVTVTFTDDGFPLGAR